METPSRQRGKVEEGTGAEMLILNNHPNNDLSLNRQTYNRTATTTKQANKADKITEGNAQPKVKGQRTRHLLLEKVAEMLFPKDSTHINPQSSSPG